MELYGESEDETYRRGSHTVAGRKVLVCGGLQINDRLATAEIYDPGSGEWSLSSGIMVNARVNASATVLPNGNVLIAGGADSLTSSELYDPLADRFGATGSLRYGRYSHQALLLPSGEVLVGEGHPSSAFTERYIPHPPGTFKQAGKMGSARGEHAASILPDNHVLVAGGHPDSAFRTAEVCEAEKWTPIPKNMLYVRRVGHTATLLSTTPAK